MSFNVLHKGHFDLAAKRQETTAAFLEHCLRAGLETVYILTHPDDTRIPTFPVTYYNCSVFAYGEDASGCPAIWNAVEDTEWDGGCGNSYQYQLNQWGVNMLIAGKWQYIDNQWGCETYAKEKKANF